MHLLQKILAQSYSVSALNLFSLTHNEWHFLAYTEKYKT